MAAYYNEIDPFAAAWLRALINAKLIADGEVDERSIADVQPEDLRGFVQCHFFAGIGGWSYALRLAGWPDDRPIWTGSCPCQSFSVAGRGRGHADARHLWPVWFPLIRERRPAVVVGEQVEGAIRHGWLDLVSGNLESEDYAVGAPVLGAHSVGAPHKRQRLYWVADTERAARESRWTADESRESVTTPRTGASTESGRCSDAGYWGSFDLLPCRDGVLRPVEPGTFPLAHGVPARVGRLRGYGNAIVPQVAAAFLTAYMEARNMAAV